MEEITNQYFIDTFSNSSRGSLNFLISDNVTTMKIIIFRAYQQFSASKYETDTIASKSLAVHCKVLILPITQC
jgi:hypothetical protein